MADTDEFGLFEIDVGDIFDGIGDIDDLQVIENGENDGEMLTDVVNLGEVDEIARQFNFEQVDDGATHDGAAHDDGNENVNNGGENREDRLQMTEGEKREGEREGEKDGNGNGSQNVNNAGENREDGLQMAEGEEREGEEAGNGDGNHIVRNEGENEEIGENGDGNEDERGEIYDFEKEFAENQAFIRGQKSKSTLDKTRRDVQRFTTWLQDHGEGEEMTKIGAEKLSNYLQTYVKGLKKKDNSEYEPDTITSIICSIDRHLRENQYPEMMTSSEYFKEFREMAIAKRKYLKASGMGNKTRATNALSKDDENQLWESGAFGLDNPQSLTSATWFCICKYYGFRGNDECRKLQYEDLVEKKDNKGNIYIECIERSTKTRTGASSDSRKFTPKMWATGSERCPVKVVKEYEKRKPSKMKQIGAPYFLSINHKRRFENPVWFSCSPLGKHELAKIMPKAASLAGLEGRYSNHAVRKTSIQTLIGALVPDVVVAQHSGHKNVESLKHYTKATLSQQKQLSDILSEQDSVERPFGAMVTMQKQHFESPQDPLEEARQVGRDRLHKLYLSRKSISESSKAVDLQDVAGPSTSKVGWISVTEKENMVNSEPPSKAAKLDCDATLPVQVPKKEWKVVNQEDEKRGLKLVIRKEKGEEKRRDEGVKNVSQNNQNIVQNVHGNEMCAQSKMVDVFKGLFQNATMHSNVFKFNIKLNNE